MTDEQLLEFAKNYRCSHPGLAPWVDITEEHFVNVARAIEQVSRAVALEEAANACDELRQLALEDMALENDERFGVYAKKYRNAALRIRALAKEESC